MGKIITVNFRGDELFGFENDDGVFVALKPIVEAMGMAWNGQFERVKRDPVMSEGIRMMRIPFGRGGSQEAVCLKFDLVNGWLFTIDSSRIKSEEVRERVILYQRECYGVLHDHFVGKSASNEHLLDGEQQEPEGSRVRLVTEARQTFGSRASGELWFKLGLPIVPAMLEPIRQAELFDYRHIKTIDENAENAA